MNKDIPLSDKIKELKKQIYNLKAKLWRYDTGLTPSQRKRFEDMGKELKLTNEAYNDVCIERDKLKKKEKNVAEAVRKLKEDIEFHLTGIDCDIEHIKLGIIDKIFGEFK